MRLPALLSLMLMATLAAARPPQRIAETAESHPELVELDDYIVKFKGRLEPLTLKEALGAGLVPKVLQSLPPDAMLQQLKADIEEVLPLAEIMAILKSPEHEALPMLMSEVRRDGSIFTIEQIKHPQTIAKAKLAQLFDLRSIFFDIENAANPAERRSINLSTALKDHVLAFREVADLLLNRLPSADAIMFGVHRGATGQYLAPLETDDMSALAVGRGVDGYCMWTSYGQPGSAVSVNQTNYSSINGCQGSLSACASVNHYDDGGGTSSTASFFGNLQGASLSGTFAADFGEICPWYGYGDDYNGFGIDGKININDVDLLRALGGGALVNLGKNYVGLGANASLCTAYGTINTSISYSRSKNREVSINKPKQKFAREHLYRVTVADNQESGLKLSLGAAEPTSGLGLGLNGGLSKSQSTTYKTHLNKEQAQAYQAEGVKIGLSRIGNRFIKKALPTLENPLTWLIGDEIVTTRSGTYFGALVMGVSQGLPINDLLIGVSTEVTGSYELRVKRLPGSQIEVTVNPTKLAEKGMFARVLNIAGATASKGVALALRQKFVFDFAGGDSADNFSAYTAYKQLIHNGQLPNELSDKLNMLAADHHPGQLIEQFTLENRVLRGKGIERKIMEIVHLEHRRLAAMAGVDVLGIKLFSVESIRAAGQRIVASESAAIESQISVAKKNSSRLHSGESSKKAYVTVNYLWESPGAGQYTQEFENIVLTAEIFDSKISGNDHNHIRAILNESFGLDFDPFTMKARHQSRTVILERQLGLEDLILLREKAFVELALRHSGVEAGPIYALVGSFRDQGPRFIAERIREFVGEQGFHGLGAVHYLLGGSVRHLKVRSTSSIYSDPIEQAEQFIIKWSDSSQSIKRSSGSFKIDQFFDQGEQILADLRIAKEALVDDKFMIADDDPRAWPPDIREDKKTLRTILNEAEISLREVLALASLDDNERLAVYGQRRRDKRSLHQQAELLKKRFPHPVQAGDSQNSLRKRFKHCDQLLASLQVRREQLKADTLASEVEKQRGLVEIEASEVKTQAIISLHRLTTPADYEQLIRTLNQAHSIFSPHYRRHRDEEARLRARLAQKLAHFRDGA